MREDPLAAPTRATVLIVCTANVCRSPLAEFVLQNTLRRVPGFELVRVESVGVRPTPRGGVCELVKGNHWHEDGWVEFVEKHRALRATEYRLGQARLVLTASRANRAALASVAPDARNRTFTLREAEWLGAGFRPDPEHNGAESISDFAEYLNSRRGLVPAATTRRRPFSRPTDSLSIRDGHNLGPREHRRTIAEVERVATAIGALLTGPASN